MLNDLTAEELIEHEKAYEVDPWGEERAEMLHGHLCSLLDSCHRQKGNVESPAYYMPFAKALECEQQSEESMKEIWQSVVNQWGD
jgi:hypothetical protein